MYIFLSFLTVCLCAGEARIIGGEDFPRMGMFAAANQILGQLAIYETKRPVVLDGLAVDFGAFGLYYDASMGLNWWNYYFEPICLGDWKRSEGRYAPREERLQSFRRRKELTKIEAAAIVKKHIRVKEYILREVEQFAFCYFTDVYTIGVHYRGTDKILESPRVDYETVVQAVCSHLPSDRKWQIFVATDELDFLQAMQQMFPGKVVFSKAYRSDNRLAVHVSREDSYQSGQEALIDCLLLSRCDFLVRTSSNLSLWSTYFNPDLPVELLSQRFKRCGNAEPE